MWRCDTHHVIFQNLGVNTSIVAPARVSFQPVTRSSLDPSIQVSRTYRENMEPTNRLFRTETDLRNLHDYVPYESSGV